MVGNDLIRRLPLINERGDDHILLVELLPGHVNAGSGGRQTFSVLAVCKDCIIAVLVGNRTVIDGFRTSIADIRGLVKAVTPFPDIISTGLITGGTGSAFDVTEDDLATYICFPAEIPMNAEVVRIIKGAFVIPVTYPVKLYLLRDGSRILA